MTTFLPLLDRLVGLKAPSLALLHTLLGAPLVPAEQTNRYWTLYEAAPAPAAHGVRHADYRVPHPDAARHRPFLVLDLAPGALTQAQLEQRYGRLRPTDVSAHHPDFVGYSFVAGGLCLGADIRAADAAVLSVAIDYAKPGKACDDPNTP